MTDLSCDVAIIGAGKAALTAERTARKAGAKTLVIDDRFAGTTCASGACRRSLIAAHGVRKGFLSSGFRNC
jgi:dihydrolipoamide dehydrogenase